MQMIICHINILSIYKLVLPMINLPSKHRSPGNQYRLRQVKFKKYIAFSLHYF